jgi:TATA-box binding protein (TBP) (component of TFIID and TFIIIB)
VSLRQNWIVGCNAYAAALSVENGQKNSHYDPFHFPPLSVRFRICGVRFHIYGNGRGVFPSVLTGSRFHPKLTRIYSVFHPVLNLYEMCRN